MIVGFKKKFLMLTSVLITKKFHHLLINVIFALMWTPLKKLPRKRKQSHQERWRGKISALYFQNRMQNPASGLLQNAGLDVRGLCRHAILLSSLRTNSPFGTSEEDLMTTLTEFLLAAALAAFSICTICVSICTSSKLKRKPTVKATAGIVLQIKCSVKFFCRNQKY